MPIHTPHFPDLLFEAARRLRRWEGALMELLLSQGYAELHPSLVMRESQEEDSLRFFDGNELVALRSDFTVSLARLLSSRFPDPPERVAYAGAIFRRPLQPWEPVERFEVGCERIQANAEGRAASDVELARILLAIPGVLGLRGAILQLGHAALLRVPMAQEALPRPLQDQLVWAISRRSPHRAAEALSGHPAKDRLMAHTETLLEELDGPGGLHALARSPYAPSLESEMESLHRAIQVLLPLLPPGVVLRVDPADVHGIRFYTGPTLRLWAPGAQQELAAGGRYDGLYPELGRTWFAAGFCVRLSRLLDLADTRPELFEPLP